MKMLQYMSIEVDDDVEADVDFIVNEVNRESFASKL